jgi:hypothetical protein
MLGLLISCINRRVGVVPAIHQAVAPAFGVECSKFVSQDFEPRDAICASGGHSNSELGDRLADFLFIVALRIEFVDAAFELSPRTDHERRRPGGQVGYEATYRRLVSPVTRMLALVPME